MYNGCCDRCKYYWRDDSVGATECLCETMTEELLDKHYTNDEPGCPGFEEYVAEPDQWAFCYDCKHYNGEGCSLHGYDRKQLHQLYDCGEFEMLDNIEEE